MLHVEETYKERGETLFAHTCTASCVFTCVSTCMCTTLHLPLAECDKAKEQQSR